VIRLPRLPLPDPFIQSACASWGRDVPLALDVFLRCFEAQYEGSDSPVKSGRILETPPQTGDYIPSSHSEFPIPTGLPATVLSPPSNPSGANRVHGSIPHGESSFSLGLPSRRYGHRRGGEHQTGPTVTPGPLTQRWSRRNVSPCQ